VPNQGNPYGIDSYFYDQKVKVWKSAKERKAAIIKIKMPLLNRCIGSR
jgi:hypothetical protein